MCCSKVTEAPRGGVQKGGVYWIPHALLSQGGSQFGHWITLCSSLDTIHLCEAGFSAAAVIKMQGLQENQWEQEGFSGSPHQGRVGVQKRSAPVGVKREAKTDRTTERIKAVASAK